MTNPRVNASLLAHFDFTIKQPQPATMASEIVNPADNSTEDTPIKQNGTRSASQRHEEYQYLDLVQDILDNGEHRPDR